MNENKILKTNDSLNDLIQRGVEIRKQRIAEKKARIADFHDKLARERAEIERAIRALLPPPLDGFFRLGSVIANYADIHIEGIFPGEGMVKIVASKESGQWRFIAYEAYNPDGYYLKLQTLEEALAYASGVLEI